MSDDLFLRFAEMRTKIPQLFEYVDNAVARGKSVDESTRQALAKAMQELIDDQLPIMEKSIADLPALEAESEKAFQEALGRLDNVIKEAAKQADEAEATRRPDLSDLIVHRGRLSKELTALDDSALLWWCLITLACLHEVGRLRLERTDRVVVALASLWVAVPTRTHPRAVSPRLGQHLPITARILLQALAMTGLRIDPVFDFSPVALTMGLIKRRLDEAAGPEVLSNYDRAIRLARGVRNGNVSWIERSAASGRHENFSVWLDADTPQKRVEAMPEVALKLDPGFTIDGWPLDRINDVLQQCFDDLSRVDKSSTDPIDVVAVRFLRQTPRSDPASRPPAETPPLVQEWAMGASSISFASLTTPGLHDYPSVTTSTMTPSGDVPGNESFVADTGSTVQGETQRDEIHDWSWILKADEEGDPSER